MEYMPVEIIYDILSFLPGPDRANARQLNNFFYSIKARSKLAVRRLKNNQLDEFCKIIQNSGDQLDVQIKNLMHPQLSFSQLINKLTKLTNITSLSFEECNYHINGASAWNGMSNLTSLTNLQIDSKIPPIKALEAMTNLRRLRLSGFDVTNTVNDNSSIISMPNLEDLELQSLPSLPHYILPNAVKLDLNLLDNPHSITRLAINVNKWDSISHQKSKLTALKSLQLFMNQYYEIPHMEFSITTLESLAFETNSSLRLKYLLDSNPSLKRLKCQIRSFRGDGRVDPIENIFAKDDLNKLEAVEISVPNDDYVESLPDSMTAISIQYHAANIIVDYRRFTRLTSLDFRLDRQLDYELPRTLTALYINFSSSDSSTINCRVPFDQLPNLEILHWYSKLIQTPFEMLHLTKLHDLTTCVSNEKSTRLSQLVRLTRLGVFNENFSNFESLAKLTDLQQLEIPRITSDHEIQSLSTLNNLTRLYCVEMTTPGFTLTCLTNLQVLETHLPEDTFGNKSIALTNYVLDKLPFCIAKVHYKPIDTITKRNFTFRY